jgi:dihydrolipoamide dehydrogenase
VRQERAPASLIVIGAGAVGVEFADVYAAYGTRVTILEALPRLVPLEDEEVSTLLARSFGRREITLKTGVKVTGIQPGGPGVVVATDGERLEAEQVLMAVGRGARVRDVGLEALGVQLERSFVKVSPRMETSVKGIYAIGDMAGPPLLAHKAMAEGVVAAEAIAGQDPRPVDYSNVPSCTYCRPQIASIGLSESRARENGREVSVGRFPFTASGKAVALGETEGFVKVVADKATGEILGVHIVGPRPPRSSTSSPWGARWRRHSKRSSTRSTPTRRCPKRPWKLRWAPSAGPSTSDSTWGAPNGPPYPPAHVSIEPEARLRL